MFTRSQSPLIRLPELDEPLEAFEQLRRQMDRLFWDFERELGVSPARSVAEGRVPGLSLSDEGASLVVRVVLPGMNEKDLELTVTDSTVTIAGERKDDTPEGYTVHRKERSALKFTRTVDLPCNIDASKASAVIKDGILRLELPKSQEAKPRQIAISAG